MTDEPDESFVIETLLGQRPYPAVPWGGASGLDVPMYAPGDDAARIADHAIVTHDTMVENVHFDSDTQPKDIGWKIVAVNASDIGAMGCEPTWATLSISLPRPIDGDWLEAFAAGLGQALSEWGVSLVGGDTTRSPGPVIVSMAMGGHGDPIIGRHGARPGDALWVTGSLGGAAASFFLNDSPRGREALHRPRPPVRFGAALGRAGLVHAMLDLSDGLRIDADRLCQASRVSARIDPEALPIDPALDAVVDPVPYQVAFGEDFQLLFCADPDVETAIADIAGAHNVRITRIGAVFTEPGESRALLDGREWPAPMFQHFAVDA